MKIAVNIVIYQLGWLACIIGAAQLEPLVGVAVVAAAVAYHLYSAPRPGSEAALIVAAALTGATTFNVSLRWFKQRLLFASLFGALGGPLAFLAGERLGGVVFTDYAAGLGALALGWALLMPLMMILSNRWDGFRQGAPAEAVSLIAGNRG